jgi:hypothetical protein
MNRSHEAQSLCRDHDFELSGREAESRCGDLGSASGHAPLVGDRTQQYRLMISEAVVAECERGDPQMIERRRQLLKELSLFPVNERILEAAKRLVGPGVLPEKAGPDAVHMAAAAVEGCDFLLTWNFRHIANVRIRREVERILAQHGYTKTTICTPEELF